MIEDFMVYTSIALAQDSVLQSFFRLVSAASISHVLQRFVKISLHAQWRNAS